VDGQLIMPPCCDGALFQMTSRSSEGNNYNPTQAGDCEGNPSVLDAYSLSWVPANGFLPGILLGVTPRLFTGSYYPTCTTGPLSPYYFNFGVSMGGGSPIPLEVIILCMTIQKTSPYSPNLLGVGSEMPSIYYDGNTRPYAYFLLQNDYNWVEATYAGDNYVLNWPNMGTNSTTGYGVMVCSQDNATFNPSSVCAAMYYGYPTSVTVSFRPVPDYNLVLNTMVGSNNPNWVMNTTDIYSMYTLNVHGNVDTINAAIQQTLPYIGWGNFGGN